MAKARYLAMTAAEFQNCSSFPEKAAWMSCHFSPWGKGLSNVPERLPPGSMLILDDSSPICGHDPELVMKQLAEIVQRQQCDCVLLDFQRPDSSESAAMAVHLTKALPCPVGVSHLYAKELSCAVLLPPVPPDLPLKDHSQGWTGRELWLELALDRIGYRIKAEGAKAFQPTACPASALYDENLCCHYAMEIQENAVDFTLFRTAEDISALMERTKAMGVTRFVGLWQEFGKT